MRKGCRLLMTLQHYRRQLRQVKEPSGRKQVAAITRKQNFGSQRTVRWLPQRCFYQGLARLAHGSGHSSKRWTQKEVRYPWQTPRFTAVAEIFWRRCVHYQHHNVVKVFKQQEGAHPLPWGPFVYIQMDFVTMPKCCNFNHIMVMVDMFTKLFDAYLCRSCDARMVAKLLFKVYLCRYGIPYKIPSDKGSHFTLHITKELWKASQIKQHFHCLYHPESAGQVEHQNDILKNKLAKICDETD